MATTGTNGIKVNAYNGEVSLPNGLTIKTSQNSGFIGLPSYFVVDDRIAEVDYFSLGLGGSQAMDSVTIFGGGAGAKCQADNNTFFGSWAGQMIDTGKYNQFFGAFVGPFNDTQAKIGTGEAGEGTLAWATDGTAHHNSIMGDTAFVYASNESSDNQGMGSQVYFAGVTLNKNVAIGRQAMCLGTEFNNNVGIGYHSLRNVNGDNNTAIGYYSGRGITEAANNIIIGSVTSTTLGTTPQDVTIIGKDSRIDFKADANGITLGDNAATVSAFQYVMTNYSALDYADDTAAAAGGVALGGLYHTGGTIKVRLS